MDERTLSMTGSFAPMALSARYTDRCARKLTVSAMLSFNIDAQLGLGEVKLTDHLTLNSLAPENWWMGYVVGNANVSYSWPVYRGVPTIMLVPTAALSGASLFFFKTKADMGQDQSDVAAANWDLLWSVYASVVVSL